MIIVYHNESLEIVNVPSLLAGDMTSATLLDTWRNADGVIETPAGFTVAELSDGAYDFKADKADAGHQYKYFFREGAVVRESVIDSWQLDKDIEGLKARLSEGDYKITKCYEASLTGETLPYDITALHAERNIIRASINELEALKGPELDYLLQV